MPEPINPFQTELDADSEAKGEPVAPAKAETAPARQDEPMPPAAVFGEWFSGTGGGGAFDKGQQTVTPGRPRVTPSRFVRGD